VGKPTRNYYWLCDQADLFVRNHRPEIVKIATELYVRGIITLPAAPAKEGNPNVD